MSVATSTDPTGTGRCQANDRGEDLEPGALVSSVQLTCLAGLDFIARQPARTRDGEGYPMVIVDRAGDRAVSSTGVWLRDKSAGRVSVDLVAATLVAARIVTRSCRSSRPTHGR